jgi:hypothetical protein
MAAHKPTKGELEFRVNKIVRMIADGVQRPEILEYGRNEWGLKRAAVDCLIRKAKDAIKESVDEERNEFMARKLFQLEDVLLKAAKRNNHPAMIGAIRLQCELAQILK